MTLSGPAERHKVRTCSIFRICLVVLTVGGALFAAGASAASARAVRYHGYRLAVPVGWPVYNLDRQPRTCVRFNRHALYLGAPGRDQSCPAHAAGRTESVLVTPGARAGTETGSDRAAGGAGLLASGGSADRITLGSSRLVATVTWSRDRRLVERILGRALAPVKHVRSRWARRSTRSPGPVARAAQAIYTGLGFDACTAPSADAMSAWASSPFRAVGVYIGGVNSACSQPNLTPSWVSAEVAAGWHLIPTYVSYQGAGSCGGSCATITAGQAGAEGAAAADDAVSDAEALGVPAGNPIYDDMEQFTQSSANTAAVLAFLAGWTSELHAAGYLSGVYSSASAAITDLVDAQDTGYLEPDDIWIGDWNGQQTTSDPYVPSSAWDTENRLHQYSGAHDDTYGGVRLNIDSDYLGGATADTSSGTVAAPPVVPDGTFVQEAGFPTVYRVAGGAPLYVSTWTPYGGPQPVTVLSAQQFSELRPYPADGTFVQTTAELNYRFAGGAPIAVSSWSVFGGIQPYVVVDQWDIDNAGNPLARVATTPADGTIVEGLPSGTYWRFAAGVRYSTIATATATQVDDVGLEPFVVGAATVTGAGTEQPVAVPKPVKQCTVPRLKHLTLAKARRSLREANCRVGRVRSPKHVRRHHTLRVFGQSAKIHSLHPTRYHVNLWLS